MVDGTSIYVICGDENGPVKIGIALIVADRLKALHHSSPIPLFAAYESVVGRGKASSLETATHKALKEHRLHGEWFKISSTMAIAMIKEQASKLGYQLTGPRVFDMPKKKPVHYNSSFAYGVKPKTNPFLGRANIISMKKFTKGIF